MDTYPTWGSSENHHLQNAIFGGYVSSLEGSSWENGMKMYFGPVDKSGCFADFPNFQKQKTVQKRNVAFSLVGGFPPNGLT